MSIELNTNQSIDISIDTIATILWETGEAEGTQTFEFVAPEDGLFIARTNVNNGNAVDTIMQAFDDTEESISDLVDDNKDQGDGEEITLSLLQDQLVFFAVNTFTPDESGETTFGIVLSGGGGDGGAYEASVDAGYTDGYADGLQGNPYNDTNSDGYEPSGYESGYSAGYTQGASEAGGGSTTQKPMKFFVSESDDIDQLKTNVMGAVEEDDIAVVYAKRSGKILLGGKSGFMEFLGGTDVDMQDIINDQAFIDKVSELSSVSLIANITANDGSVVLDANVTQTGDKTFEITVPDELVGTEYKIVLSEAV